VSTALFAVPIFVILVVERRLLAASPMPPLRAVHPLEKIESTTRI
jgi:hypothetical protein